MKTTLIRLNDSPQDGAKRVITPPIGLWSIRENVPDVEVIDLNVQEMYAVGGTVGYSLQFPSQERSLEVVRLAYVNASREIVGGPYGGLLKKDGMESWYGPGENFFLGNVSFNDLSYPHVTEKDLLPYWKEASPFGQVFSKRWLPIETSRGCPNNCGFCAMPSFWGGWQGKDPLQVEEYVQYLLKELGPLHLIILDDNISLKKDRFLALIEIFNKYDIPWSTPNGIYARTLLDLDVLAALMGSTCKAISLPFETGSSSSAFLMNIGKKYLPFLDALYIVRNLNAYGIHTTGFFIIGYPGETEENVRETLRYANALPLKERYIYFATPYQGTRLHAEAVSRGLLRGDERTATYKTPLLDLPQLPRERLLALWKEDHDAALRRKG